MQSLALELDLGNGGGKLISKLRMRAVGLRLREVDLGNGVGKPRLREVVGAGLGLRMRVASALEVDLSNGEGNESRNDRLCRLTGGVRLRLRVVIDAMLAVNEVGISLALVLLIMLLPVATVVELLSTLRFMTCMWNSLIRIA